MKNSCKQNVTEGFKRRMTDYGSLWEAPLFQQNVNGKTVLVHAIKAWWGERRVSAHTHYFGSRWGEGFVDVTWLNLSLETSYDYCCDILHGFFSVSSSNCGDTTCNCATINSIDIPSTSGSPIIVLCCTIWVEWTKDNWKAFSCPGKLAVINLDCQLSLPRTLSYDIKKADSLLAFIAQ
jgi:hypothetical protein